MGTIWLEIDGSKMMAVDFATFLEFLNINKMQYASYYDMENNIVMEAQGDRTEDFNIKLSQFIWFQPIIELDEEPDISDIDLIEEMSNIS